MSIPCPPGTTIGILGGGQLGRMLAIAAARLGYHVAVLDPDPACPAAQVANHHIQAPYDDNTGLDTLVELSDIITYEFENVPVNAALGLAEQLPVFPPPDALETAQDRLAEKIFLNATGISTAPFVSVDSSDDLVAGLQRFGGDAILKTRRLGYDGKGQHRFSGAGRKEAEQVFRTMGDVPLILESFVAFSSELSVIAALGRDGSIAVYDPSRNVHRDGILHSSTVPARLPTGVEKAARQAAADILKALDYVGVIGIEFFVLDDGTLLANEIAPRVHNSGHWTEAACAISQFEQHIRAITGLPLGDTKRHSDCVMENLIGEAVGRAPELAREPNLVLHLYGKNDVRPGRKMGHFTRIRDS